jgi:phosphate starvation-inducible PhoH-like protein
MRGRTLKDAVVILDEAQNCSYGDLRTFLTRTGENAQVIVNGDTDQTDIDDSGLAEVLALIERHAVDAAVIRFTDDDVVRSEIARQWVRAVRA